MSMADGGLHVLRGIALIAVGGGMVLLRGAIVRGSRRLEQRWIRDERQLGRSDKLQNATLMVGSIILVFLGVISVMGVWS